MQASIKRWAMLCSRRAPIVYSLCHYGRSEVWKWGAKLAQRLAYHGDISDRWRPSTALVWKRASGTENAVGHCVATQPDTVNDPECWRLAMRNVRVTSIVCI